MVRGPVSPSGSIGTRSPNSSAPARNAASAESAGRLPTSNRSSAFPDLITTPSSLISAGPSLPPEPLRRERRAFAQCLQLRPGDVGVAAAAQAAVGPRDHVLATDEARVLRQPVRD